MEKKDWKERIDINIDRKPYEITLDGQPIRSVNHLEKWIERILQQELDKAREEGRKEGLVENLDKRNSEGGLTILESLMLSKLKTKEEK